MIALPASPRPEPKSAYTLSNLVEAVRSRYPSLSRESGQSSGNIQISIRYQSRIGLAHASQTPSSLRSLRLTFQANTTYFLQPVGKLRGQVKGHRHGTPESITSYHVIDIQLSSLHKLFTQARLPSFISLPSKLHSISPRPKQQLDRNG
jgi:hypothetical protein